MPSNLFKVTVTQHWLHDCWIGPDGDPCGEGAPGARFVKARKVPKGTAGAKRKRVKSRKWYGRVPGSPKRIPLSANKVAAQQMLAELVRKAELRKANIFDPFEAHRTRPLLEHVADFEAYLKAKGNGKHARDAAARVRRVVNGCGFAFIGDLALSRVQQLLAALPGDRRAVLPLDPAKEWYTRTELA